MADELKIRPLHDRKLLAGFVGYVLLNIACMFTMIGPGNDLWVYLMFFVIGVPSGICLLLSLIQVGERPRPFTWYAFFAFLSAIGIIAWINFQIVLGVSASV